MFFIKENLDNIAKVNVFFACFELMSDSLTTVCPIHVVTFTLISDYIQKRMGESGLFSFEYNLLPNTISQKKNQIYPACPWASQNG